MRVISYNLRKHRAAGELANLVERYAADILCLQEADTADIPEHIDVDVTNLDLHGSIRLREVPTGKWTWVTEGDTMLVHVVMPKAEESATAAAEGAAPAAGAEPEVVKKGKADKEEDGDKDKKDKK